jgi:His-Xaa-Ser system protein HxsD
MNSVVADTRQDIFKMEPWIYEIGDGKLRVELSLRLYPKEIIAAALYPFTDRCFIFQHMKDADTVYVLFEPKVGATISLAELVKVFANTLIDQQLRFQLNCEFGSIRETIVQHAFAPVTRAPLS